jgi:hypothetical protein
MLMSSVRWIGLTAAIGLLWTAPAQSDPRAPMVLAQGGGSESAAPRATPEPPATPPAVAPQPTVAPREVPPGDSGGRRDTGPRDVAPAVPRVEIPRVVVPGVNSPRLDPSPSRREPPPRADTPRAIPPSGGQQRHGALAAGWTNRVWYAAAWNHSTGDAAEEAAMEGCHNRAPRRGADKCQIIYTFTNCAAIAWTGQGVGFGAAQADTKEEAVDTAMERCQTANRRRQCTLAGAWCAGDTRRNEP